MKVVIIGGFLGSGKTTTILNLIKKLSAENKKTALVVNEVGEIGIDGKTLEIAGIPSKELTSGCICCSLTYSLQVTVSEIADIYNPEILIIEPTGLSFPSQIRDEMLNMNIMMSFAPVITLVDVSRFTDEIKQMPKFAEQQLKETNIVGMNKIDLVDGSRIKLVEMFLKSMTPNARLLKMSGKAEETADLLYEILFAEEAVFDEKTSSEKSEKLNSIEYSNVSTYSGAYHLSGELTIQDAGKLLENIISGVGADIGKENPSFVGHIKMAVKIDDTLVKVSYTAGQDDRTIEADYISQERTENNGKYELIFLAAVTNVKKEIVEEIVDRAFSIFLSAKKLEYEKQIPTTEADLKKPIQL